MVETILRRVNIFNRAIDSILSSIVSIVSPLKNNYEYEEEANGIMTKQEEQELIEMREASFRDIDAGRLIKIDYEEFRKYLD